MANQTSRRLARHRATSVSIRPTSVNWICMTGVLFYYDKITEGELISSGLLSPDEIPRPRPGKGWKRSFLSDCDTLRVTSCRDGTYNVRIQAEDVLGRDTGFKSFLGKLLSDTSLSLVRGERP